MLKSTQMLRNDYRDYKSPQTKISRERDRGTYTKIIRGLYETDADTPGYVLAGAIYYPSYLSFEFALSWYDLIPERAELYTSATFRHRRKKEYHTPFGNYLYKDAPADAYPYGIRIQTEGKYMFQLADPEKALCDTLYDRAPVRNLKEIRELLFEDLRIDEEAMMSLDLEAIQFLATKYHSTNVRKLAQVKAKMKKKGT